MLYSRKSKEVGKLVHETESKFRLLDNEDAICAKTYKLPFFCIPLCFLNNTSKNWCIFGEEFFKSLLKFRQRMGKLESFVVSRIVIIYNKIIQNLLFFTLTLQQFTHFCRNASFLRFGNRSITSLITTPSNFSALSL